LIVRRWLLVIAVALIYVGCAKLGLALAFRAAQVTAVWPPTGFAIAAVLLLGRRSVPGILIGAFLANATAQEPLWVAAGIAVGNTLEAVVGAMLLQRLGFDRRLARVRDVMLLLVAVVLSPIVSATIGVISLGAGGVQQMAALPTLWWVWWLGDALGALMLTPLLVVWVDRSQVRRQSALEGSILLAALLAVSVISFIGLPHVSGTEYVVFPFLIWAALRFGPAGSVTATAAADVIAVWATHLGAGPFAGAGPEQGLVPLQIFMAVAGTTGLLLGAVAAEDRRTKQELRLRVKELADADQRKDEFLAMLGHELRNPLAPVVHSVELLGRRDEKTVQRARDIIRRQSAHLTRLVDDLLDVSRITRGSVKLERRHVALHDIVGPAVETWRHLITQQRQELSIKIPDDPVWLDVDPTRFTQVIANLLHNAAKFTPPGGTIAIVAEQENGWMILRVRDSGEGMSPDVQSHAFELFVQGPPPLDRPRGGLGLGLTLVRRLVELHGGTIEASSGGSGRGSEFTVRVPVVEPPMATESIPGEPDPSTAGARRVLVVEDNEDAREALTLLLEESGHEVRAAADGFEALQEAEQFMPNVVLLDIGLPGLDGYAVARKLRELPCCSGAVLVAITGYGQPEDRALARAAGFDHHLLKPVEPTRLFELLRR
jgi:signal transduction histidine kinase/CheY-like chemotaxis protein